MINANKLISAKIPIIGSEKKNTDVALGAAAPRNTKPIIAIRRIWRETSDWVKTVSAFSPK